MGLRPPRERTSRRAQTALGEIAPYEQIEGDNDCKWFQKGDHIPPARKKHREGDHGRQVGEQGPERKRKKGPCAVSRRHATLPSAPHAYNKHEWAVTHFRG